MNTYFQYLKETYTKIVEACLQDQSIQVLKTMENKDYLLLRINQLFSEIYVAERENKIQELLRERQQKIMRQSPNKRSEIDINLQTMSMVNLVDKNQRTQKNQKKSNQALILKENEQLRKQIEALRNNNKKSLQNTEQTANYYLKQKEKQLKDCREDLKGAIQELRKTRQQNEKVQTTKSINNKQLQTQITINNKLTIKNKELALTNATLQSQIKQLMNMNQCLNEGRQVLEEKIVRMENSKQYDQELIEKYEKQVASMKEKYIYKVPQHNNNNNSDSFSDGFSHLQEMNKKQIKIGQLMKLIKQLQQTVQNKQVQHNEYKIVKENKILQLTESIRKTQCKYERDNRINKQENRKAIQKVQQLRQEEIKKVQKYQRQLKEKELVEKEILIQKYKQESKFYKQYVEKAQLTHKQQKICHKQETNKLQGRIEEYKRIEKEKYKELEYKQNENHSLEKQLQKKIDYQKQEIVDLQQELKKQKKKQYNLLQSIQENNNSYKAHELKQQQMRKHIQTLQTSMLELEYVNKNQLESLAVKTEQLKGIKKKLQKCSQTILQLQQLNKHGQEKCRKVSEKMKQYEEMVRVEKEKVIRIQQNHNNQITQIYENYHNNTENNRKQTQQHYITLLKNIQKNHNTKEINKTIQNNRITIKDQQQQIYKLQQTTQLMQNTINNKNKQVSEHKRVLQELQSCKQKSMKQYNKVQEQLQAQRQNKLQIVKYYEHKISVYYSKFREYKLQFCMGILNTLNQLKNHNNIILNQLMEYKYKVSSDIKEFMKQYTKENEITNNKINNKYNNIRQYYELQVYGKMQTQKQQLLHENEQKLKQKTIQIMTILAEKEYEIQKLKQSIKYNNNRNKQEQNKMSQFENKINNSNVKNEELKDIIKKMENKVLTAQKEKDIYEKQYILQKQTIIELTQQIKHIQHKYKNQLKTCKQKYVQENQKMFGRYEKQFNKMINISKKSKEYAAHQIIIPTKGQEDKVDKLKRQIHEQKKKLQKLQKKV